MKQKEFKKFTQCMQECKEDDPIWYCGYLFLDLTPRQADRISFILAERFGIKEDWRGNAVVYLPSGIGFVMPLKSR